MLALIIAALIGPQSAIAGEYKLFYLTDSGKQVEADEAIKASLQGSNIYKCQSVEMSVSKSGTSVSLKNIKKPKTIKKGEKVIYEDK